METVEIKLGLEHDYLLGLQNPQGDQYVAVMVTRDNAYCTYAVDKDGNCYWGHYMLKTQEEAIADLYKRAGMEVPA